MGRAVILNSAGRFSVQGCMQRTDRHRPAGPLFGGEQARFGRGELLVTQDALGSQLAQPFKLT